MIRREKVIRRRLEAVSDELDDIEGDTTQLIEERMSAYQQALEWVLREREQDTKPPLGSRWRHDRTVTGRQLHQLRLTEQSPADEIILACQSHGEMVPIVNEDRVGSYRLLYQSLDPDIEDRLPEFEIE